jgi:pSer/pThr/pTyr-binding forkhead associated (FHA) protein
MQQLKRLAPAVDERSAVCQAKHTMGRSLSPTALSRNGESRAARFRLLYRGEELVLEPGQYVIGRSPSSDVVVDDPLVSRRHARLLANDTTVLIEDLRSDNGVFVNEERIRRSVRLGDGDRILVGHQELVFSVLPPNATQKLFSGVLPLNSNAPPPLTALDPVARDGIETVELNAFTYLGELFDQMLSLGRPKSAEKVLSAHLWDVLQAARRGDHLDRAVIDGASLSAMRLAAALRDAGWVHYVLELHVIAGLPLRADETQILARLLPQMPTVNRSLFNGYQRALMARMEKLSPEDVELARAVLAIGG